MTKSISFDLHSKTMIVTGAGRGIGRAIAEVATEFGADLVLGGRNVEECEAVAEHCDALDAGAVEDVANEGEHAPVLALLGRGLARAA